MAYIYKITNDVNGKIYIGKTQHSIQKRFKEHCSDYKRARCEKRPLYSAMKKYGIEHFHIEQIDECSVEELCTREIYWIDFYDSYHNGYNATYGGDGKPFVDTQKILKLYQQVQNMSDVSRKLNICVDTVKQVLLNNKVKIKSSSTINSELYGIRINMIDINTHQTLQTFPTAVEAAKYVCELNHKPYNHNVRYHIVLVCRNVRKSAEGYLWEFSH